MTKKEEFKNFMKEEGKKIAIGAAVGAGLGLAAYGTLLLYCKGYEKGVIFCADSVSFSFSRAN